MKNYDVVIIGAGPSGVSCAYNIKRNTPNLKVLIVDKASFPRYKPCGGGISPEVANYLDFDLSPSIDYICNDVIMVANGKQISGDKYPLWMVRREKFDSYLLDQAKAIGVEFMPNCEVIHLEQQTNQVSIICEQISFNAQIAVLAEGGRGKLAKKYSYTKAKQNVLAAMEYEHYTNQLSGKLYIDFDYNDSGYAWNFPKSDGLSLGIGGLVKGRAKGKIGLPQRLANYSSQFGVKKLTKTNLHGHPIMLYSGKQRLVHNRVILVGEIAGCVDPLTAEGIRPAIKSGYLAAKIISHSLTQQDLNHLRHYDKIFQQEIGKDFQYARLMAYFLNRNLTKILPLISSPQAINAFMSVFSGKEYYRDKITWKKIGKFILRTWR
ncbi:MAG: hypothetical protein RLZZ293_1477 [Pseudomonadota bacterium]|jgi:geranylgeranyl reductase family protein